MIRHLVSLKFKPDAPPDTAERVMTALRELPARISVIRSLQVGRDLVRGPNSADVGLIVDVDDLEALSLYRDHPAHRKVVDEFIRPSLERIVAVDFTPEMPNNS